MQTLLIFSIGFSYCRFCLLFYYLKNRFESSLNVAIHDNNLEVAESVNLHHTLLVIFLARL